MAQKREGYAPFSIERKAGVQSATVNGTIDVVQEIRPTLTTGFVDEKGDWKGLKSSEEQFHSFGVDVGIPNTGTITQPQVASGTIWPIDMTGFKHLYMAIRPTNGGNYAIKAIMGPADLSFANLRDVNAGTTLRGNEPQTVPSDMTELFSDGAESLTADVWNIFLLRDIFMEQKLLQFIITNNSGGESDIETAFMRLV